jgi:hypothetical protein
MQPTYGQASERKRKNSQQTCATAKRMKHLKKAKILDV